MTLKNNIDIPALFAAVNTCVGDVYFCTEAHDRLNLKSQLTRFLFLAISQDEAILSFGRIEFSDPDDISKLELFLR